MIFIRDRWPCKFFSYTEMTVNFYCILHYVTLVKERGISLIYRSIAFSLYATARWNICQEAYVSLSCQNNLILMYRNGEIMTFGANLRTLWGTVNMKMKFTLCTYTVYIKSCPGGNVKEIANSVSCWLDPQQFSWMDN